MHGKLLKMPIPKIKHMCYTQSMRGFKHKQTQVDNKMSIQI